VREYINYIILKNGSLWACPELLIRGILPEVKKAVYQIHTEGWHTADVERYSPAYPATTTRERTNTGVNSLGRRG